jgi:beta-galactosidase
MKKTIMVFLSAGSILLWGGVPAVHAAPQVYNGQRGASFNTGWKFHLGDIAGAQAPSFIDGGWRVLNLPHDWSIELPFDSATPPNSDGGEGYLDGGIGWYRKSFTLPAAASGERVLIEFDGVYMNSTVFINGDSIGVMPYGYSTYEFDLTGQVVFGPAASNILAVRVNHQLPSSRWYPGSGIYRNVWLTLLNPVHIAPCGTFVSTPSVSAGQAVVSVATQCVNQSSVSQSITLTTVITNANGALVAAGTSTPAVVAANGQTTIPQNLTVTNPSLWSPASPYLYSVKTMLAADSALVDSFVTTMGIRTIRYDANFGFFLNGQSYKILGCCNHHCVSALGAAFNQRAAAWELQKIQAMGCNAIRTSHNPPAPELLDLCDKMGLLVMEESFDCWNGGKNTYDYGRFFTQWAQTDLGLMVRRDRNHPCVIMWSVGNEIGANADVPTATSLRNWVRNDDTTRPVTWARNGPWLAPYQPVTDVFDIAGFNYGGEWYDSLHGVYPNRKIFGSETSAGGIWGGGFEDDWQQVSSRAFVAGEFFWTGFDYQGESTWPSVRNPCGRITTCGFPKDYYYFYQSRWSATPMVHICANWNRAAGSQVLDTVYSNCDTVELFLNGVSKGAQAMGSAYHLTWTLPYAAGTLKAVGRRSGIVIATDSQVTAGAAARIVLTPDRSKILSDGSDLSFVTAAVVDTNGVIVPGAADTITFSCSGAASLAGVDNGDSLNHLPQKGVICPALGGRCLAIMQSNGQAGAALIYATAPGLVAGEAAVTCTTWISGVRGVRNIGKGAGTLALAVHTVNGAVDISYAIPASGVMRLAIYDFRGRRIRQLFNGFQEAGAHHMLWGNVNAGAREASPAGMYLCRLQSGTASLTKAILRP